MDNLDPKTLELLKAIQESKKQLDLQKLNEASARANQPYTEDVNMIDKVSRTKQNQSKLIGLNDSLDLLDQMNREEQLNKELAEQKIPRFSKLLGK